MPKRPTLPAPLTLNATVARYVAPVAFIPFPVMVSTKVPARVVGLVVMLRVEVAPLAVGMTGLGLILATAPTGNPLTERFTGKLYPLSAVNVTP
jgi:hypothetical protein